MRSALSLVSPELIHEVVSAEPHYQQNRDRTGAVLHDTFSLWDGYQAARPVLFVSSLAAMAGSGYMWYKRGLRRGKWVAEAHAIYPAIFLVSSAVGWFTRPGWLLPPASETGRVTEEGGVVDYIDGRVDTLKAEDPNFADKQFARLFDIEGVKEYWNATPKQLQAFIYLQPKKVVAV